MGPAAALREELVRARRSGVAFDVAWPQAVALALEGVASSEWGLVFAWAEPAFQNAYCRRGTARLAAAVQARELAEIVAETVRPPAGSRGRRLVA